MKNLFIGVMSGTSLDGIDAILIDFKNKKLNVIDFLHSKYSAELKKSLLNISIANKNDLEESIKLGLLHAKMTAKLVQKILKKNKISHQEVAAIGYHGQTIRHRPEKNYSIQIGNAHFLTEHTHITVVSDFRNRDIIAGGQGAPLVPVFHEAFFASKQKNRVILNIGGISNITYLKKNSAVSGFDCGPGNILMDAWCQKISGKSFDNNGDLARDGSVDRSALKTMLKIPFFKKKPPKSTGRELFNLNWAEKFFASQQTKQNIQRTLLELTSQSIFDSISKYCPDFDEILVCGGGSKNKFLIQNLQEKFNQPILFTGKLGLPEQQVEAAAFAWLAKSTLAKKCNNSPQITGSQGARILGVIHHR